MEPLDIIGLLEWHQYPTCPEKVSRIGERHHQTADETEPTPNEANSGGGQPELQDGDEHEASQCFEQEARRLEVADHDRSPTERYPDDVKEIDVVATENDQRFGDENEQQKAELVGRLSIAASPVDVEDGHRALGDGLHAERSLVEALVGKRFGKEENHV